MCGYIGNVTEDPLARTLMRTLSMEDQLPALRNNPGCGPAASVDIIIHGESGRLVVPATWWLLLDTTTGQPPKPSKYTSFNTRSDKLNVPRSAGYQSYRQCRCIVPATYIIEGEGLRKERRYHRIEPAREAFALGGLFRQWLNRDTGEQLLSCSVITLPPHPDWKHIHSGSTPLMLPAANEGLISRWLDPQFSEVTAFAPLLTPVFHDQLTCTPVERPGNQTVVGDPVVING